MFWEKNVWISLKMSLTLFLRFELIIFQHLFIYSPGRRQVIIWTNGGYFTDACMRHSASTRWQCAKKGFHTITRNLEAVSLSAYLLVSFSQLDPASKVYGANMGPTWVLSAPDGSHVGPINFAIWEGYLVSALPTYLLKGGSHLINFLQLRRFLAA